jgi:hypothetical protein
MLGRNWLKQNNLLPIDVVPVENFHDYEILKGNIGTIKEGMNRYGSRIHTEDNNHMILNDYSEYLYNNEIYKFSDVFSIANIEILLILDNVLNQKLSSNFNDIEIKN